VKEVTDIESRRRKRHTNPEFDGITCPTCGGDSFLCIIQLDHYGEVLRYRPTMVCIHDDCAEVVQLGDAE
jgi:hypothetical protein